MKKHLSLFLALVIMLTLAACGSEAEPEAASTPTPTEAPTASPEPTPTPVKPTLGTVEGNEYVSDFLGIRCSLGEYWSFFSEEEIAEINQLALDDLNGDVAAAIKDAGLITDMAAQNPVSGETVNIGIEDIGLTEDKLSTELYIKATMQDIPSMLEEMGIENVTAEKTDIVFAGKSVPGFRLRGSAQGYDFFETMVFIRVNSYLATLTASSFAEDTTQEILDCFTAVK